MSISESEALAGLQLLVAVAKADGRIADEERKALEAAIEPLALPEGLSLTALLAREQDVDALVAELASAEARAETLKSAYGMAHADGECSKEEQALLDRLQAALGVADADVAAVRAMFEHPAVVEAATRDRRAAIEDPAERDAAIRAETTKTAMFSAVLGAFPVPGLAIATDLAVLGLQVGLVRDIGAMWGREVDKKTARAHLYQLGVGTGARLAISNLAKLFVGWGSLVGATTSFASTWAIGSVMNTYFARAERASLSDLEADFKAAQREGKKAYSASADAIASKKAEVEAELAALTKKLDAGEIDQAEYERRAAALR